MATCGLEPHGRSESISAAAKGWGGPGGAAPMAGTVGCSSVPFRSRPFQCARIGFGWKEAALDPAGAAPIDAQSDFTSIVVLSASHRPAARPAGGRAAVWHAHS